MRDIEDYISPLIESQFPSFYQEEGPLFILFAKEYFKWLESNDKALYYSRNLLEYRDLDKTIDSFLVHFKEKYLSGVDFTSESSKRTLIKAALDLFRSKGSERSMDLLFKLAYGAKVEVYTPGDDILKLSDGTWVVPKYLELSRSSRTLDMVGRQVTGSKSGATAFIEYVITRNINDKIIDIAYLSNLVGDFSTGDIITENGIIENAPKVTGSLSTLDLSITGQDFTIGEIVNLTSARGVEGRARVTGTFSETGLVSFTIVDGGWGFSTTAQTFVSNSVITITNITNANTTITGFERFETIAQNLYSVYINDSIGEYNEGDIITNTTSDTAVIVSVTQNNASNTANLVINPITGNILSNTIFYSPNTSFIATNTSIQFTIGDLVRQSNGSSNVSIGYVANTVNCTVLTINASPSISANGLHPGTYIVQTGSGASGYLYITPSESNHAGTNVARIVITGVTGSFNNTGVITAYPSVTNTTALATATPNTATPGYVYTLSGVAGSRWSTSNNVFLDTSPTTNTTIMVAAELGGVITSNTSIKATANVIGSNSTAIGLKDISNTFYTTNNSIIFGLSSNTFANSKSKSTGSGAGFNIGSIEDAETVRLSPDLLSGNNDGPGTASVKFTDMLLSGANSTYGYIGDVIIFNGGTGYNNTNIVTFTGGNTGTGSYQVGNATITTDASGTILTVGISANVGNGIITTPSIAIVNSTGGSSGVGSSANIQPAFPYGFVKLPTGDASYKILDLLRFETKTIGTIVTLTGINPGENYNTKPFDLAYEPLVASYGKKDILIEVSNAGPYVIGEAVEQVINSASIQLTSNNYSGNTGLLYEVGEQVIIYNGATPVGNGYVYSSTRDVSTNTHTTVITSNTGLFTNGFFIVGQTTHSNSTITNSSAYTASATAKGRIKTITNGTKILVKRTSLFTEFTTGDTLYGKSSGANSTILSVSVHNTVRSIGDNANISSNVITSAGAIDSIEIVDSGFGYEQDETVTISSTDGLRIAEAKANITKHGYSEGYYSSTRGFLDDTKAIHDGDYYQEYSYEIQSSMPFEKYSALLKEVLHVAGTKPFGRVKTTTNVNLNINVANSSITTS